MSDDRVQIQFDFEADPQAIGRIENALDNIAKQQEKVTKSFQKGNISLKEASNKQRDLNSSKTELLSIEKSLNAEADRANIKREEAILGEQRLQEESKAGLRAQQDRFDTISRDVSLAGDFQSNLGAIRGLSSAAGFGGVSQGLDIAGESVALIEELPRLLAAAKGLPDTLRASAAAIKLMSLETLSSLPSFGGFIAGVNAAKVSMISFLVGLGPIAIAAIAATIAIAALIAIFAIFRKSSDDSKKASEEQLAAEQLTTQAAQERLETIAEEQTRIAELTEIREANGQKTDDLKDREKELSKETDGLTIAMESGATAINDTAQAEQELANQRSEEALEAGDDAAALEKIRQQVRDANTEELNQIIQNLADKKAVLAAERDALKATGDESEETTARIEDLNDGIGDLEEQMNEAGSATNVAAAAEKTLAAERVEAAKKKDKDDKQALKAANAANEKARKEAAANAKKISDKAKAEAKKRIDIQTKANEDLIKLQEKFRDDTADAFRDAKRGEAQETREADKSRLDLLKELGRSEEDLIASGDIFAIADLREQATEDLADLRTDFDFDAEERRIQRNNEATDRLREAQETRRKLVQTAQAALDDLGRGQTAIRGGWRNMLTGLGNDLSQFTRAITSRSTLAANRPSGARSSERVGVNVSIDGAPVRAIVHQEIRAVG